MDVYISSHHYRIVGYIFSINYCSTFYYKLLFVFVYFVVFILFDYDKCIYAVCTVCVCIYVCIY